LSVCSNVPGRICRENETGMSLVCSYEYSLYRAIASLPHYKSAAILTQHDLGRRRFFYFFYSLNVHVERPPSREAARVPAPSLAGGPLERAVGRHFLYQRSQTTSCSNVLH
jgi:hypothetical protein